MKKLGVLLPIACCLLFLFCNSCKKGAKITDNSIGFDSINVAETYYLFNDKEKPSCNLQFNFVYPVSYSNQHVLKNIQNIFVSKFFGDNFTNMTPAEAAKTYQEQYIEEYKRFEKEFGDETDSEEDEEADETGYSYYSASRNTITFNNNGLICFMIEYNNYAGGAHGSHGIFAYVINLTNGTLLQEEQIFGESSQKNVAELIVSKIAAENGVSDPKELENLGYNSIEDILPSKYFIVDDKGITYFYNENEIAGYSSGITKVFLPYKEIGIYMKKDSPIAELAGI